MIHLIQNNWPTKKLGEVSKIRMGETLIKKDLTGDGVSVYSADSLEKPWGFTSKNKLEFTRGAIIVGARGTLGSIKLPDDAIFTSTQTTIILSPQQEIVSSQFLFYYLRKVDFKKLRGGGGIPMLTVNSLNDLEIPLPPLPIQQKIVKVLDTIQEAIEIQEKIIEKTKELKKSLMAELFKYGAPSFRKGRKLKKTEITEIGEIPEEWEVVRLEKVVIKMKAGGTPNTSEGKYWGGGIAFTLIEDLVNAGKFLIKTNASITQLGLKNSNSWVVPENSIILSLYATVGKPVINKIPVAITQNMIGIIPHKEIINLEFLYYVLENSREKLWKYTDLSVYKHITTSEAKKILIPLPPLLEQQEIAEILQTIDQKIEIEQKKKELYEELFKTMLNKIMNQEIDVEKIEI